MKRVFNWIIFFSIVGFAIYLYSKKPHYIQYIELCKQRFQDLFQKVNQNVKETKE